MKQLITILTLSLLFSNLTMAQSCKVPPSCADLGYTMSQQDCSGKDYIKCPFDNSKIYCQTNDSLCNDNDAIIIKINVPYGYSALALELYVYSGIYKVESNTGDKLQLHYPGNVGNDIITFNTNPIDKCTLTSNGCDYTIKICGTFTKFRIPKIRHTYLSVSFNKSGLQTIEYNFNEATSYSCTLTELPELPTSLVSAPNLFVRCQYMTGVAPPFSNFPNLTNYENIFSNTQVQNHPTDPWPDDAW